MKDGKIWNQHYESYRKCVENGESITRYTRVDENGVPFHIGTWLHAQRTAYKEGRLTAEQIQKMEDAGFEWTCDRAKKNLEAWQTHYDALKKHLEEGGSLTERTKILENGKLFNVGNWIQAQRHAYRTGKLSEEKLEALKKLGIVWDPNHED